MHEGLRQVPAECRFLSVEPLLGRLGPLRLHGIDWVICGGQTGRSGGEGVGWIPGEPMDADWAREVRDQCLEDRVAFFFKQWGGIRPKSGGRTLDGIVWDGLPSIRAEESKFVTTE